MAKWPCKAAMTALTNPIFINHFLFGNIHFPISPDWLHLSLSLSLSLCVCVCVCAASFGVRMQIQRHNTADKSDEFQSCLP